MKKSKIPKNLDECIEQLKQNSSKEELEKFKNFKEEECCIYHHGCGTNIRNNWGLWTETSPLVKYFNSIKIYHADDMSGIIFTSIHRHLNGKDIELEKQITFYLNYWKVKGYKDGNPTQEKLR